jgi:hypothetical protein
MALLWLRADTMAGIHTDDPQNPDVYFNARGYLCFVIRRIKRGGRGCTPFIRQVSRDQRTKVTSHKAEIVFKWIN